MENNPTRKKFRGFKYMVLALLIVAVFGLAWYSLSGPQSGEQRASMKEKASSLVADSKERGNTLMDKADDIKAGIGDTIAKGREKVSSMASEVGDKTGEMVQAASEAGSNLAERVQSTADARKEWIQGATSPMASGEVEMDDTGPSADVSEQASSALGDGRSQINSMMEDTTESMMEDSSTAMTDTPSMSMKDDTSLSFKNTPSDTMLDTAATDETKSGMEPSMTADAEKVSDMFKERMSGTEDSTQMGIRDQSQTEMSDKPMSNQTSDMASSMVQEASGEAKTEAEKVRTFGTSPLRCVGIPPKGKDLGDHYIVAVCETLSIISERTGVGLDDLKGRNPQVENPDLIFPHQRLWLPPRG